VRIIGPCSFMGGETDMGIYMTGTEGALALLFCMAPEAPEDSWLPLAQSIKFVPVDETAVIPASAPTPEPTALQE
jgi:hypothetical protein